MLGVLGAMLGGCASTAPAPGARALEGDATPVALVDLARAYPLDPRTEAYVDADGRPVERAFRSLGAGRAELLETVEGEAPTRVMLSRTPEGDVVIHETARPSRNLLTRFEPPLLFLKASMAPGETVEQRVRVETLTLDDPPGPRDRGEGVLTLTRLADRTPTGRDGAGGAWATLDAVLTLRLGPATVRSETRTTLDEPSGASPGGLRSRDAARTVRVFGLVVERERDALRRANSSGAGDFVDTP